MIYYRQEKNTCTKRAMNNPHQIFWECCSLETHLERIVLKYCVFYITTKLNTYGKYILRMKFIRYYLLYIKNNNYIKIIKLIFIEWSLLLAVFQQNYIIEHQKNIFSSLIFRIKIHWGYQLLSASIHCCATLINI